MRPFPLFLCFVLMTAAWCAEAQVYQWKDKNGRTVVSDTPPAGKTPSKIYNTEAIPEGAGTPAANTAEQEQAFLRRQQETQQAADLAARTKATEAQRRGVCGDSRRQLALLQSGERIALRNDQGERYFMEDDQRAQEIARMQQFLERECKGF